MKVVKTFCSTKEMMEWMANSRNITQLEENYPREKFRAALNLIAMRVEVTTKEEDNANS